MITILLEKIKALLIELKTNIENIKPNNNYSTNEVEIGTWTDGSKLYKKSYVLANSVYITTSNFSIPDVTNTDDMKWITYCEFTRLNSGYVSLSCAKGSGGLSFKTDYNQVTAPAGSVLTLYYTKNEVNNT